MRILLLNQAFYPDLAATAQAVSDLAAELAARGHEVTALASRTSYAGPQRRFPARETWRGVNIVRVNAPDFGKAGKAARAAGFAAVLALYALRMLSLPRPDVIVALTTPPLVSWLAALAVALRGGCTVDWIMDLNPDEAVAAGWLRAGSPSERLLRSCLGWSLRRAAGVVALDRFMRDRLLEKGVRAERIAVLPPWPFDDRVRYDPNAASAFRARHGLIGKRVVMYAGNHSPCHPLDTLMRAAERMRNESDTVFCFLGGGSLFPMVRAWTEREGLDHVKTIDYVPAEELAGALSAADAHVVVMGHPFVGIIHPSKIYNALRVGAPVLYIGPRPSHVTDLLETLGGSDEAVEHGEVDRAVEALRRMLAQGAVTRTDRCPPDRRREDLLAALADCVEAAHA